MTPLDEHQLLIFWVQLAVLVAAARGLGGLMRRYGQPSVVGELAAGLVIGPSVLGRALPDVFAWLFPQDPVQSGLLLAVAWVGVALLLLVTGFETDLRLLARLGRSTAFVSAGSLLVPLAGGALLGWALPATFMGSEGDRSSFVMFMAVALSISALPVVAKILLDMGLMRRNVGQVTIAAAMINDLLGWILLGVIAGVVASGRFAVGSLLTTLLAIVVFAALAFTVGQRVVDAALRRARRTDLPVMTSFTVLILTMLAAGAVTQAIGVEAVLGALVAGVLAGRSRYQHDDVRHTIETMTHGFFAPVFFATAGLFVDLGLLLDLETALWTLGVIAAAALTKLVGSYLGGRAGGLSTAEGLAVGVGLNARGALEIVVATIGLSLAVLNQTSYTVVVVMAIATSVMAPPLLRRALPRIKAGDEEAERLKREAMLQSSVVAKTRSALLPTRGGTNSLLAARLLDLSLQPDASVTIFTVHNGDGATADMGVHATRMAQAGFTRRTAKRVDRTSRDPASAIRAEASLGYGLVALGMTEIAAPADPDGHAPATGMSPVLRELLTNCAAPLLLVRHALDAVPSPDEFRINSILVPAMGTRIDQAAQEIAYTLASRVHATVAVVHVVNRVDGLDPRQSGTLLASPAVSGVLTAARSLAERYGTEVATVVRSGEFVGQELLLAADEVGADLIVLGARARDTGGEPFLGHGVEYVLEHARQTVVLLVFPVDLQ